MRVSSVKTSSTVRCKVQIPTARLILSDRAHPINHAFMGAGDWLVSFVQKFRENWKVRHRIFRSVRVGLNIDNVFRWMPGKILFKIGPGTGQDPATRSTAPQAMRAGESIGYSNGDKSVRLLRRQLPKQQVTREGLFVLPSFWTKSQPCIGTTSPLR